MKILWYIIVGICKLIAFYTVVFCYPFCMLPAMLADAGGMKDATEKVHSKFDRMLSKIAK